MLIIGSILVTDEIPHADPGLDFGVNLNIGALLSIAEPGLILSFSYSEE